MMQLKWMRKEMEFSMNCIHGKELIGIMNIRSRLSLSFVLLTHYPLQPSIALWKDPDSPTMVMRPAQILEGRKKTVFVNFIDLCNIMHRQPEHVMSFLLAAMRTSGSLDGQQRLVVKGRFGTQKFEVLLRHYIRRYVICSAAKIVILPYQRTISSSSNVERYCFPSDLFI